MKPDKQKTSLRQEDSDITDHKPVEESQYTSKDGYQSLFNVMEEGVAINEIVLDEKGDVVDYVILNVNPAFAKQSIYKIEEIIGKRATDVYQISSDYIRDWWKGHTQILVATQSELYHEPTGHWFHVTTTRPEGKYFANIFTDITERKRAEQNLRESEEKLSLIINTSPDAIGFFDANANILMMNPAAAITFGYENTDQMIGKNALEFFLPEDHEKALNMIQQVFISGIVRNARFRLLRKNGEWFDSEFSCSAMRETDGKPKGIIAVTRDITDRVHAEEAQKESEAKYRLLFENMQEGFSLHEVITDENGHVIDFRFLDANSAYEHHTGFKPREIIGRTMLEIMPKADMRQIENYGKVALTGEPFSFEYYSKTYNRHLRVRAFSPRPGFFATIFEDITEHNLAETILRDSEEKFRAIIEQSSEGVLLIDEQGRITEWNRAHEKITGISQTEAVGQFVWNVQIRQVSKARRSQVSVDFLRQNMLNMLETGQSPQFNRPVEMSIETISEGAKTILQNAFPIKTNNGYRIGVIIHDITDRKRVEISQRESEEKIRAIIEQSSDGITLIDEKGHITEWNLAQEKVTGISQAEAVGQFAWDIQFRQISAALQPGITLEYIKQTQLKMLETGQSPQFNRSIEMHIENVLGEQKTILQNAFPIKTEKGYRIGVIIHDITERKQADEALRESQARFQVLFEKHNAVMLLIDPASGQIVDANEAAAKFYGYPVSALKSMNIEDINVMPAEEVTSLRKQATAMGINYFIFPHRLASGEIKSVEVHSSPVSIQGNQFLFSIIHDITERKNAEAALEESEEKYHQFFEQSSEGIALLDETGCVIEWNAALEQVSGLAKAQVLGKPFLEIQLMLAPAPLPPRSVEVQKNMIAVALQTGQAPFLNTIIESSYQNKISGEQRHVQQLVFPIKTQTGFRLGLLSRDITDRKQAEEALRKASSYNRRLIEASIDPLVVIGPDGRITDVNKATEIVTGVQRAGLIDSDFSDYFTEPDRAREGYQHVLAKGQVMDYPLTIHHVNGKTTDVLYNATVYENADGKVEGVFAAARDITERKRAEAFVRNYAIELEKQVQERTAELVHASHAKDEFLATMSHELRTPLNGILGFSETLLEGVRGPMTERQSQAVQLIQSSGQHLLSLINDILDVSKIEAGKFEIRPERVEVRDVCRSSITFVKQLADKKSIIVDYSPSPDSLVILADPKRLTQILVNLLNNAVKFTPEKGLVTLEVQADAREGLMGFSITDTGIGISQENLQKLFKPFVQVDGALSRKYEGTGLGLALTKKMIELHHGSIEVQSEVGVGSRFTFVLPWKQ